MRRFTFTSSVLSLACVACGHRHSPVIESSSVQTPIETQPSDVPWIGDLPVTEEEFFRLAWADGNHTATLNGHVVYLDLTVPAARARLGEVQGPVGLRVGQAELAVPDVRAALRALPHPIGLNLGNNTQVSDGDLVHLVGLTQLASLYLHRTQITDAGLVHLAGLTQLEVLNLASTQTTDTGLVHLAGLTQLKVLCLNGTQITDAGLVHLAGLTQLESLNFDGTQITDTGIATLPARIQNVVTR